MGIRLGMPDELPFLNTYKKHEAIASSLLEKCLLHQPSLLHFLVRWSSLIFEQNSHRCD